MCSGEERAADEQKLADRTEEEKREEERKKRRFAQKDTDAQCVKKNNGTRYGYKEHVKVDAESRLIVKHSVTAAPVHDSRKLAGLVDSGDRNLYAYSAYVGEEPRTELNRRNKNLNLRYMRGERGGIR